MSVRVAVVAVIMTLVAGPGHAWAQAGANNRNRLEEVIRNHDRMRIRTGSGWVELWDVVSRDGTASYMSSDGMTNSPGLVSLAHISRIQVRGSAARVGATIGGMVGGAGGLVGGAALGVAAANLCVFDCIDPGPGTEATLAAMGGLVGLAGGVGVGALVGALVGWPVKKWRTVYRVPD